MGRIFVPMLFQAFFSARRGAVLGLLALGAAVGLLEGGFVLLLKRASEAASLPGSAGALTVAGFVLVTLRSLLQVAAARLETSAVRAWIGGLRAALLEAVAARRLPVHRDPHRSDLARALDRGLPDIASGAAAGLRCFAAAAQAAVLLPLLLAFAWRASLAAAALALPALALSRLRSASLARAARRHTEVTEALSARVEDFAGSLEAAAGNGRLAAAAAAQGRAQARREAASEAWERTAACYPPLLEWAFFASLAALLRLAAGTGAGAAGPASLVPFAALLLLLYRPIREWARAHPARLPGEGAFAAYRTLLATLEARPRRGLPGSSPDALVRLERLRFRYGGGASGEVFSGLDAALDPGELTWLPGPNGCGKSTLLRLLAGVEAPDAGRILLPERLRSVPPAFAYLPQRAVVEPDWLDWAGAFARERPEDWAALDAILALSPLLERAGGVPGPVGGAADPDAAARAWAASLSGGQRQRVCLARVFASPAPCLLLDEPTTWLAAGDRERMLGDLLAFWRRTPGRGAIVVSHEPFLGEFCSRTLRLAATEGAGLPGRRTADAAKAP